VVLWSVDASLDADESAVFELSWLPPVLTPVWVAFAAEPADCSVVADCSAACACPEPPHPTSQLSLLSWVWSTSWLVSAELDASDVAELSRLCVPAVFRPGFLARPRVLGRELGLARGAAARRAAVAARLVLRRALIRRRVVVRR
jgi:hypothetical protein